jgi:hypothetical protein
MLPPLPLLIKYTVFPRLRQLKARTARQNLRFCLLRPVLLTNEKWVPITDVMTDTHFILK